MNPTSDSIMNALLDLLIETPNDIADAKAHCLVLAKRADRDLPRVDSTKLDRALRAIPHHGDWSVAMQVAVPFALGRVVAAIDNMPTGMTPSKHRPQRIMWARDTFIHAIAGLSRALDGELP